MTPVYSLHFCTALLSRFNELNDDDDDDYPSHLRHVATLPWEIKNSNFLHIFSRCGGKCKQIAF